MIFLFSASHPQIHLSFQSGRQTLEIIIWSKTSEWSARAQWTCTLLFQILTLLVLLSAIVVVYLLGYGKWFLLHTLGLGKSASFCFPVGISQYWTTWSMHLGLANTGFKHCPITFQEASAWNLHLSPVETLGYTWLQYVDNLFLGDKIKRMQERHGAAAQTPVPEGKEVFQKRGVTAVLRGGQILRITSVQGRKKKNSVAQNMVVTEQAWV